mmetsp:Transcript_34996/g.76501  ORF Transcript_34996/g.76501 Transcript_34996/m.76501 type:complete len:382 (-) Transcript_34996:290-1435(-)|eukprot:CAMPEP_0118921488 /NCGR_PEP_ID=MMETSP1169-20130426/748_1 /TAXON_ID=36882 /ORGANISM="Pyramimonas obovata, Strain CCMP722" /LENGTH=381 /DNA_ID=CAMNT_0006862213 /DNA_START=114 /DNA_END=1259 /DNA_ORIENTATION=+
MASDGCQSMPRAQYPIYGVRGWYEAREDKSYGGQTYASQRSSNQQAPAGRSGGKAKTGTWDGPAPVGSRDVPPGLLSIPAPVHARKGPGVSDVTLPMGAKMPLLGMSTEGTNEAILKQALQLGYRHFDCSPEYANEAVVGSLLNASNIPREELFVTSKLANDMHGNVKEACEGTLKALGMSYLDLYVIAWPVAWKKGTQEADEACTLEQTWAQLEALVDAGLVKYIGMANFDLPQAERILAACRIKPAAIQLELHPLLAQRKLVGVCKRKGFSIVAHHPYPSQLATHPAVAKVAGECGQKPAEAVLRWNVERRVVVVVPGNDATLVEEGTAVLKFSLLDEEKRQLDALDANQRSVTPAFMTFADPEQGGAIKPSAVLGYGN